jgi:hypothetical protein
MEVAWMPMMQQSCTTLERNVTSWRSIAQRCMAQKQLLEQTRDYVPDKLGIQSASRSLRALISF